MAKRICTIPDCENPVRNVAHGWCRKHYRRWLDHGDPQHPVRTYRGVGRRAPLTERFWVKVDKGDGTGCWLWTAATNSAGYGVVKAAERLAYAHRVAYELLVGPIPEGLELDHVKERGCTSTLCVKAIADEHGPAHLEPVTHRENGLRSSSPMAQQARQDQCKRGHELTGTNVYRRPSRPGKRECRRCAQERETQTDGPARLHRQPPRRPATPPP